MILWNVGLVAALTGLVGCASAPPLDQAPVPVVAPQADCSALSGTYDDRGTWLTAPVVTHPKPTLDGYHLGLSEWVHGLARYQQGDRPLPAPAVSTLTITAEGIALQRGTWQVKGPWRPSGEPDSLQGRLSCDQGRLVWTHGWFASGGMGPLELIPGDRGMETLVLTRAADGALLGTRIAQSHRWVGGYARRAEWVRWGRRPP